MRKFATAGYSVVTMKRSDVVGSRGFYGDPGKLYMKLSFLQSLELCRSRWSGRSVEHVWVPGEEEYSRDTTHRNSV